MNNIIIIGAGVSGMNIFTIIQDINSIEPQWNIIAYFDEHQKDDESLFDIPILNTLEDIISETETVNKNTYVISAIGDPGNRHRLMGLAHKMGFKLATIVHPMANISKYAKIEKGCIICQFASVHPFAYIKKMAYIHTGVVIGPKVVIGENATINSLCAISANTKIGSNCYIGVGTKMVQDITIGNNSTLGAGSVVIENIPDNCLAVGMPAKVKKVNYGN